ncbi:hypothetical protein P691DRAFT_808365 [Macrolepiota fuliginosa MF-IS2]|uniref:S-adenosyl-L-methionine-dependent methyltransferase n=1 Tax=Macrolepiota fuliginosa MF-IS2 TaxID=1400762 RepID=A0A9P5X2S4_9AGAR|nr:hypothetical protein P691DRAFT_808365 [Macrolepiota fuliginosa MF-IS2]
MDRNNATYSKGHATPSVCIAPKSAPIPIPPTSSLPPLGRLLATSTEQVASALTNLRCLYFPLPPPPLPKNITIPKRNLPKHLTHGSSSVPDSGYASADEEEDENDERGNHEAVSGTPAIMEEAWEQPEHDRDAEDALELLKADPFERAFAIKWVTGFISRCDTWIELLDEGTDADEGPVGGKRVSEAAERTTLMEEASTILSLFSTDEEKEEFAVTRTFNFPLSHENGKEDSRVLKVELNDALVSNQDHTSVGLQSWASAILLGEKMAASPSTFLLAPSSLPSQNERPLRILELGAGTGMLSIVAAKILAEVEPKPTIVATDYHPDVLENLKRNVQTNFPRSSPLIEVKCLDWEHPQHDAPLDELFDIILAADVIYHPDHARWIKGCVEEFLRVPNSCDLHSSDGRTGGGVFWLMIAVRSTGRHEGMDATVDALFPDTEMNPYGHHSGLVILEKHEVGKQGGLGRADEGGYRLFKIGWNG